jgi:capsular polysaccharide transport system permease protein
MTSRQPTLTPRNGPTNAITSSFEGETPLESRLRLAAAARKARLRQRLISLGIVLTPVVLAVIYLLFLVKPQYQAEARFTVQASQVNSSAAPSTSSSSSSAGSILSSGGNNMATGFVDGWAVEDFLNSRDCMRQLDRKIGLRKYLTKPSLDPFNHVSPNANEDELFNAYGKVVHSSYNLIEEINVMDVDAFSPGDSTVIANGLLAVVQDFVNRMDQQGIDDALKVNRQAMEQAEAQDRSALAALTRWRLTHGNVDPGADATMLMTQIGVVQTSLSTALVTLDQVKAMHNPDHPMLAPAQQQVDALTARLADLRTKMSGQGNTSADQLKTYVDLTNAQTFADSSLMAARQNYQQAYVTAMALQRYLAIVAAPVSEVTPSQPNPGFVMLSSFAIGVAAWGAWSMGLGFYRSFRHG